jgi:hypothetical protein
MRVEGLESDGVALIGPDDPDFDARVDALAPPGMAPVIKGAKPYVVIVSNKTARRIVAVAISWETSAGPVPDALFTDVSAPSQLNSLFMAPNAIGESTVDFGDRSERAIPPGGQRLFALGFAIPAVRPKFAPAPALTPGEPGWDDERIWNWIVSTTAEFAARIKEQAAQCKGLGARLDAVIFDDGRMIGSDTMGFLSKAFQENVDARQDLYRTIVDRLSHGASVDVAFPPQTAPSAEDILHVSRMEAIGAARDLRKKYGDDGIHQTLEQAILKEPFVIHR